MEPRTRATRPGASDRRGGNERPSEATVLRGDRDRDADGGLGPPEAKYQPKGGSVVGRQLTPCATAATTERREGGTPFERGTAEGEGAKQRADARTEGVGEELILDEGGEHVEET